MASSEGRSPLSRRLVRNLSHDLKSPLASVQDALRLLLRQSVGELNPTQQELVQLSHRNVDQVRQMIVNLTEYYRLAHNMVELERQAFSLEALIEPAIERWTEDYSQKGVALESDFSPDTRILGDRARLSGVLDKLLDNALTFCGKGDMVRISGVCQADQTRLIVDDSGPGLPEGEIFEPFFPLRAETRSTGQGIGLGLAISALILAAHGGTLTGDTAPEGGARLVAAFPPG